MLTRFLLISRFENLDGFVFEIPDTNQYGQNPTHLGKTMMRFLTFLSDHDPSGERSMSNRMKETWQFRFNYQRIFVTTFAPFYLENHPRYAFGSTSIWILFQPEISFTHHQLPIMKKSDGIRERIRKNFLKAGRPYIDPSKILFNHHVYVRPLDEFDEQQINWEKND